MSESAPRDTIDVSAGDDAPAAAVEAPVPPAADVAAAPPPTAEEQARLTDALVDAFKTVYDPEIPVDIYELGLIYKVDLSDERFVTIEMTLTAPGCPVAGEMPGWVEDAARRVEGVADAKVNLVFDPPWDISRMSDEARLQLNIL